MKNLELLVSTEVILGNSNPRFSGVTSTMLGTLEHQQKIIHIKVMGRHHLPNTDLAITFRETAKLCRQPLPHGRFRIFHARRNDEMIQALILKYIFKAKIHILFTSTAQRHHSKFTRLLIQKMDAVISTCSAAAQYLEQKPRAIIPHGVDSTVYFPQPDTHQQSKDTSITLGIFGRVREQKGVHLFVESCIKLFKDHKDAKAIIVGAISKKDKAWVLTLQNKIDSAKLSDRIRFLGEQPFERLPELIRSTNIVAALSKNEGFGLTVLEAMASGAAVIATKAGAWPEIIEQDVNGYIVSYENPKEIIEKIDYMLNNPDLVTVMGKRNREKIIAKYSIEDESKKLCDVYKNLQHEHMKER